MDKETAKSSTGSKSRNLGGGPFWPWWACLTADLFWRFLVCVCVSRAWSHRSMAICVPGENGHTSGLDQILAPTSFNVISVSWHKAYHMFKCHISQRKQNHLKPVEIQNVAWVWHNRIQFLDINAVLPLRKVEKTHDLRRRRVQD